MVDNAVAVFHDRGAYLQGRASQQQEIQRIAPCGDAADAEQGNPRQRGIAGQIPDKTQGDGSDARSGIPAYGGLPADVGIGRMVVRIDACYAFDGIDGGQRVSAVDNGRHTRQFHVARIGRHLGDDGQAAPPAGSLRVERDQFGILTDVASQPLFRHLGAGKIALDHIRSRLFGHACQLRPLLLILSHDGGDDDLFRMTGLQSPEYFEILFGGTGR